MICGESKYLPRCLVRGKSVTKCPYEKGGGEIYMSNTKTDLLFVMGILIIDNKYSCNPADQKIKLTKMQKKVH